LQIVCPWTAARTVPFSPLGTIDLKEVAAQARHSEMWTRKICSNRADDTYKRSLTNDKEEGVSIDLQQHSCFRRAACHQEHPHTAKTVA
jgi:hypothetical protein